MVIRTEDGSSGSTGLTQEIDIMDIGSSTPKRKKSKSPLKGVLKIRSPSDRDDTPTSEPNTAQVLFSTPVSSLKAPRSTMSKLKTTRFQLPPSTEKMSHKSHHSTSASVCYISVSVSSHSHRDSANLNDLQLTAFAGFANVANKLGPSHRRYAEGGTDAVPHSTISSPESSRIK